MSGRVKQSSGGTRAYDSALRRSQAQATERRILDAARASFAEHGYVRTSMAAIAGRAGVDPRTVYKVFGSKVGLLSRLVDVAMVGDQDEVPVMGRPAAARAFDAPTAADRVAAFAATIRHVMERAGEAFRAAAHAAVADSEAATLWAVGQRKREEDVVAFVSALREEAMLRRDRSPADAVASVWLLTSPETYFQLIDSLGWGLDEYERWLEASLADVLLEPGDRTL